MALLLQGLVALVHNPAFRSVPALDGLVSICTPDGWKTIDRHEDSKPFGTASPASELCALCQTLQAGVLAPPDVILPVPARAFVLVSAASPPFAGRDAGPDPSPRQTRAPPASVATL